VTIAADGHRLAEDQHRGVPLKDERAEVTDRVRSIYDAERQRYLDLAQGLAAVVPKAESNVKVEDGLPEQTVERPHIDVAPDDFYAAGIADDRKVAHRRRMAYAV
jgi:hypothetical protein